MIIHFFCCGPFQTNAYVVGCKETRKCAIVDPAPDSCKLLCDYIDQQNLSITKILLTHTHLDHTADVACLQKRFPVPVWVHREDAQNLRDPGSDGLPNWFSVESIEPDLLLCEKDLVEVGRFTFEVIHTPGHSPGSICFYEAQEKTLFSGDTLFHQSIGTLSLPTAQPDRMWSSLEKLASLPKNTRVFPGHGVSTSIGAENWLKDARHIFG